MTSYYLYTFRPQINEQDLLEDFLSLFLPFLEEFTKYSYSIEEDGTLNKHIHVIYTSKATDNSKAMPQKLNQKLFLKFKSALKNKMTTEKGFDDRKVKEKNGIPIKEDYLKVLGYVNKAVEKCWRRKSKGFTNEEIKEATDFYYANDRLDKSQIKNDLIIMNPKNIHISIKDYCIKNNLEPTQPITKLKMIKDGYCFDHKQAFREIEINLHPDRFPEDKFEDESYDNLVARIIYLERKEDEFRTRLQALEKYHKCITKSANFSGVVQLRGLGSDEEWITIP